MRRNKLSLVEQPEERRHHPYRRTARVPYPVDPLLPHSKVQALKALMAEPEQRGLRGWLRRILEEI